MDKTVFFCIPPLSSLVPYPAIPYLVSSLRQAGYTVDVFDLNIIAYNLTLSRLGIEIRKDQLNYRNGKEVVPIQQKDVRTYMDWANDVFEQIMLQCTSSKLGVFLDEPFLNNISLKDQGNIQEEIFSDIWQVCSTWINKLRNRNNLTIVGFHVISLSGQLWSTFLAQEIKKYIPNALTVFGGPPFFQNYGIHNVLNPNMAIVGDGGNLTATVRDQMLVAHPSIDVVVIGEGEQTIVEIANKYDGTIDSIADISGICFEDYAKRIIATPKRQLINPLDSIPFPDYSDLPLSEYPLHKYGVPLMPLLSSRGCIAKCTFCTDWRVWHGKFRCRSPQNIIEEIKNLKKLYGIKFIRFNDSLLNGDIHSLELLCDLLIKEKVGVEWITHARIRSEMDKKLLTKMNEAGCRAIFYGLESGSPSVLKKMKKGLNLDKASNVFQNTSESGITNVVFTMVNFPGETDDDFQKTVDFVIKNAPYIDELIISQFVLLVGSTIENCPQQFGIEVEYYETKFGRLPQISSETKNSRLEDLYSVYKQYSTHPRQFPFFPIITI